MSKQLGYWGSLLLLRPRTFGLDLNLFRGYLNLGRGVDGH
jgi:hypothetical protein